jgi:dienelactone hydrolase
MTTGIFAVAITTKTVNYVDGLTVLEGYVAAPVKMSRSTPAVLIFHQWKGLGPYERSRADLLAKAGYIVLAADIYGQGIRPTSAQGAAEQATIYKSDRQLMRHRAQVALDALLRLKNVNSRQVVAIGYCFGGTVALELARSGAQLAGVVSLHGNLDTPTPADAKNIKGKVLVLHGADDPYVPAEQVLAFQTEMRLAECDWQMVSYGGAVHAFTDPSAGGDISSGAAYNQPAAARAWVAMMSFFDELF